MISSLVVPTQHLLAQQHDDINEFLDAWHLAAENADEETFFGSMSPSCVYIGTDASERWTRDELKEWSIKYFQRESAWAFTPRERNLMISEDGNTAWFSELLETWMGICRGSGVLQKNKTGMWQLEQYHLGVTVNNDLIKEFIELVKQDSINDYLKK